MSNREDNPDSPTEDESARGNIGQWLVYAAYRVFEGIFILIPLPLCFLFGKFAGWVSHLILPGYRKLVRRNLSIAFAGEKSDAQIRQLARDHFVTLGANLVSSIKLGVMPRNKVEARLSITGLEHRDAGEKDGHGLVYIVSHIGSWEIIPRSDAMTTGAQRGSLYQPLSNPYLDRLVRRRREQDGAQLFNRSEGFYAPIRYIKSGGALGVLVDQHAGDKGVWCPFFGRLASTTNLAALLALKTGAKLVPIGLYTRGLARWELVIYPPVDPKLAGGGKIEKLTAELNTHIADVIRESPQDWFWVHNRWKTPKPNFLINSYKRGSVLPDGMNVGDLKPFRILVSSPNPLGDACMAIPAVKALKRGRPDAWVAVLVPEGIAELWRSVAEVDAVIPKQRRGKPKDTAKLITDVAAFDVAVLFPNSPRSAMEASRADIPRIVGYKGKWRSRHIDHIIVERPPAPTIHHVYHYLDVVKKCGANIDDPTIYDPPKPPPEKSPNAVCKIGLCPGAEYGDSKRWPIEKYATAAAEVSEKHNAQVEWQLFGSPGEVEIGNQLATLLDGKVKFQNRIGKTTITELMEEMRACDAVLTNDTGTLHLAAYLGAKVIAVFTSTDPTWTGPLGKGHKIIRHHVECGPCFLRDCPLDHRCMESIPPTEVAAAVLATL